MGKIILSLLLMMSSLLLCGQCVSGDCEDGYGKMRYANHTTYEGYFRDHQPYRSGKYSMPSGMLMEGTIRNQRFSRARIRYSNGDVYWGEVSGRLRDGKGRLFSASRQSYYEGSWEKGKLVASGPAQGLTLGKTYAFLVSLEEYILEEPLDYPNDDAELMKTFLQEKLGVDENHIWHIQDQGATVEGVERAFRSFVQQLGPFDRMIFYFAGHANTRKLACFDEGWPYEDFKALVKSCQAEEKIIIIDACNAESLKPRTPISASTSRTNSPAQVILLLGARETEDTHGFAGLGHGVFTYSLVTAVQAAADTDRNGIIDIIEWHQATNELLKTYLDRFRDDEGLLLLQNNVVRGRYSRYYPIAPAR